MKDPRTIWVRLTVKKKLAPTVSVTKHCWIRYDRIQQIDESDPGEEFGSRVVVGDQFRVIECIETPEEIFRTLREGTK